MNDAPAALDYASPPPQRSNPWLRPYAIILLIIAQVMMIQAARRKPDEFTTVYTAAAGRLVSGQSLYPEGTAFVYPPFCALIAVPFVPLPVWAAQALVSAINFAALGVVLVISWRLAGGNRPLVIGPTMRPRDHAIALLASLCALRLAFNTISHQQTDLVIAALMMIGCACFARGKSISAAVFWGLGAAFKATPLVFCGYLLWRGRWAAAPIMLATAVAANLLPDAVHRGEGGTPWAAQWVNRYVAPLVQSGHKAGDWNASLLDNQSLAGMAGRLLQTEFSLADEGIDLHDRPGAMSPAATKGILYASYLLIGIVAALVMRPAFRRLVPAGIEPPSAAFALEFSIVFMVILLVSPMSSRAHFCTLILPALCLARAAIDRGMRVAWTTLIAATVLTLLSFNLPFVRQWNRISLWLGFVTLATICLLIGCLWLRWRIQPARGSSG